MESPAYNLYKLAKENQFILKWSISVLHNMNKILQNNPDILTTPLHSIHNPKQKKDTPPPTIAIPADQKNDDDILLVSLLESFGIFTSEQVQLVNTIGQSMEEAKKRDVNDHGLLLNCDKALLDAVRPEKNYPTNRYGNGDVYVGHFLSGKRHGKGSYSYSGGNSYMGEFYHDKPHGIGHYTYDDGCVYFGTYDGGRRHGRGKYFYTTGSVYDGEWYNDKKHGKGSLRTGSEIYFGQWTNNVMTYTYGKLKMSKSKVKDPKQTIIIKATTATATSDSTQLHNIVPDDTTITAAADGDMATPIKLGVQKPLTPYTNSSAQTTMEGGIPVGNLMNDDQSGKKTNELGATPSQHSQQPSLSSSVIPTTDNTVTQTHQLDKEGINHLSKVLKFVATNTTTQNPSRNNNKDSNMGNDVALPQDRASTTTTTTMSTDNNNVDKDVPQQAKTLECKYISTQTIHRGEIPSSPIVYPTSGDKNPNKKKANVNKSIQTEKSNEDKETPPPQASDDQDGKERQCNKRSRDMNEEGGENPQPKRRKIFTSVKQVFEDLDHLLDQCEAKDIECDVLHEVLPKRLLEGLDITYTIDF